MTRFGPRRTPGDQLAEAVDLANRLWPGKFWLFGKGSLSPTEPLYGFRVFDPDDPDSAIVESEHDDPYECVMRSIDAGRATATSSQSPPASISAYDRVANALDPEVGLPSDHLLRSIHADLEIRGRKNSEFAVSVHHRNIVLSAAAKAVRSRGMPWNEWLEKCNASTDGAEGDAYQCPICDDVVRQGDVCATDIELGTCHAACLQGAPTVDLATGDAVTGPIPTFRYEAAAVDGEIDGAEQAERLARWAHTFIMAERWKGDRREEWDKLRPEMRQWWLDEATRFLNTDVSIAEPDASGTKARGDIEPRGTEPDFASSIAALFDEERETGSAFGWRACTGCHETNEGAETGHYPYSKMFGSFVGSGCTECGGLGVVWEYWSAYALESMQEHDIEPSQSSGETENWRDDPSADERWNAGIDYSQVQLCKVLGVDPDKVTWDAATETLDGDVQAVIGNILAAAYGDDWCAALSRPAEGWRPMESAPKDGTHILLLTSDFGAVEGWWDVDVTNFYKSQEGWASYDPDDAQGDWVSDWRIDPNEARLFCGATPTAWHPLPSGALIIAENRQNRSPHHRGSSNGRR